MPRRRVRKNIREPRVVIPKESTESISVVVKKVIPARPMRSPKIKTVLTTGGGEPTKTRAPRRKITLESHLQGYHDLIQLVNDEIERRTKEKKEGIRILQGIRKRIRDLEKQVPKIANTRRKTPTNGRKVSGFTLLCEITNELADFMGLPHGATPSRAEITNSICMYVRVKPGEKRPQMLKWDKLNLGGERNLQDPSDSMAIIPDSALSDLLGYGKYKKDVAAGKITTRVTDKETKEKKTVVVTEPTIYYRTIQILIQRQIIRSLKKPSESDAAVASSSAAVTQDVPKTLKSVPTKVTPARTRERAGDGRTSLPITRGRRRRRR